MKTTFTIDNAIARFEKVAANYKFNLDMHHRNVMKLSVNDIERMKEYIQENRQLAEWLKKLKAYEEAKEKIELKAEKCPQDEIRYGMRSALYILEKCLEGSDGE